jgi:hypothetical protein
LSACYVLSLFWLVITTWAESDTVNLTKPMPFTIVQNYCCTAVMLEQQGQ